MSNENMSIYAKCSEVPSEAKKEIGAGRLKGMIDINPMWRIKKLTEMFGACGFGWYYDILEERLETIETTQEIVAFVRINLFYKLNGEWSKPIPGIGGNKLVIKETKGLHVSDECFKMALSDAIGGACKALGMGASVYYQKDRTKYDIEEKQEIKSALSEKQLKRLFALSNSAGKTEEDIKKFIKIKFKKDSTKDLSFKEYDEICKALESQNKKVDAQ